MEDTLKEAAKGMAAEICAQLKSMALTKLAYTAEEAAFILGVSEPFIYELVKAEQLSPVVRLGKRGMRIPAATLEEFVTRGGVKDWKK